MIAPHRNRWIRIQGVTLVMLVMSQIDRANIALAFPSMRAELGLSATAIGFATGVFFGATSRCKFRWGGSRRCGAPNAR